MDFSILCLQQDLILMVSELDEWNMGLLIITLIFLKLAFSMRKLSPVAPNPMQRKWPSIVRPEKLLINPFEWGNEIKHLLDYKLQPKVPYNISMHGQLNILQDASPGLPGSTLKKLNFICTSGFEPNITWGKFITILVGTFSCKTVRIKHMLI